MNKGMKISLIVAGSLCGAGVLLSAVGLAVGGFSLQGVSMDGEITDKTFVAQSADINSVTVDVKNQPIDVVPTQEDKIRIEYKQGEFDEYSISEDGQSLRFTYQQNKRMWVYWLFGNFYSGKRVTVYLPAQYAGALKAQSSNASVNIRDLPALDSCRAESSNGSIEIENTGGRRLEVKTSNARITLRDITGEAGEIKTSNGRITLSDSLFSGTVTAETSNAEIRLESLQCGSIQANSSNGRVSADSVTATDAFSLRSSNASIELDRIDSPDIYLKSSNGSIQGTISGKKGDYRISSSTSNGGNNLGENDDLSLTKRLEAYTSNASIRIDFVN